MIISDNRPIGVFDSGGGLDGFKELQNLMPYENIIWLVT